MPGKIKIFSLAFIILLSSLACSQVIGNSDQPQVTLVGRSANAELTLTAVFSNTGDSEDQTGPTPTFSGADASTITPTSTIAPTLSGGVTSTEMPPTEPLQGPTLIPAPTVTPVLLTFDSSETPVDTSQRTGPSISAAHLSNPPVIDGDVGDWQTTVIGMPFVVFGEQFYANEQDLFGEFKIAWDENYLYIGIIVRDTRFTQLESGSQLHRGDSIELLLDVDLAGDFEDDNLSNDDYQLGFSPGNLLADGIGEAYIWAPEEANGLLTTAIVAGRLTPDGYMVEIALPWSAVNVNPNLDMHLGFLLSVSDNDSVNASAQQSMVSFAPLRLLHDPTAWYDLVLAGP